MSTKYDTKLIDTFLDKNHAMRMVSPLDIGSLLSSKHVIGTYYGIEPNWLMYLKFLFSGQLSQSIFDNESIDLAYIWGIEPFLHQSLSIIQANQLNIPVLVIEDSFLRSICVAMDEAVPAKYRSGIAFTIDDLTAYYDATRPSRLELMLNDSGLIVTGERKARAAKCINKIIETHLSKYNHQPIYSPNIGRKAVQKVLVVDQKYSDMSVVKGLANDDTFKQMLECAIKENPEADIIVKTHPDSSWGGYYQELKTQDNVYLMTEAIDPISLIQYCDKVYVCTTQLGFEALMCKKEVHVFGMPFYAGWGLTHDRQKCERRNNVRTVEEVFYIAYVMYTYYVSPKAQSRCEIEEAIDYLLALRDEYHKALTTKKEARISAYEAIKKLIKEYSFESVLDIGCGDGQHSRIFQKNGKVVTLLDYGGSPYFDSNRDKGEVIIHDFMTYDFEDKQYDCVWCSHVLEHQLNVNLFLKKVHAILKEDGVLAITVPPLKHEIVGGHMSLWNMGLLLYHLVMAGFDCSGVIAKKYAYNISVILRKKTINVLPKVIFDAGDIGTIREYLPEAIDFANRRLDITFDGDMENIGWD